jgi:hypothetical protein
MLQGWVAVLLTGVDVSPARSLVGLIFPLCSGGWSGLVCAASVIWEFACFSPVRGRDHMCTCAVVLKGHVSHWEVGGCRGIILRGIISTAQLLFSQHN